MNKGLRLAIKAAGGKSALARVVRPIVSRQAVNKWTKVPLRHLGRLEQQLRIPRQQLRPDLYRGMQ